ncbi:hypothetical protein KFL_003810060 [Klebsormidium nitens]|uniref:C2H2-type domain-containing protein n=1 Tax=Klebsormidium nitens TaxID=105231 RepID=A0A1Y1ID19_KLENI|nr:hypothetical protein KFL_003810060 [Klebsormidium nitens]|eukprot:GAQ87842.1 hypothetical protein KFL_003810060 [Klebsormidium nitens]
MDSNFPCPICGKKFDTSQSLGNHRRGLGACGQGGLPDGWHPPQQLVQDRPEVPEAAARIAADRQQGQAPAGSVHPLGTPPAASQSLDQQSFRSDPLDHEPEQNSGAAAANDFELSDDESSSSASESSSDEDRDPFSAAEDGFEAPRPLLPFDPEEWLKSHDRLGGGGGNGPHPEPDDDAVPRGFKTSVEVANFLTNNGQGSGSSNSEADWLLRILLHPDFNQEEWRAAFSNSRELRKYQDTPHVDSEGFIVENMRLPSDHQDLWFRRKDPIELLRRMFANPELRGHIKLSARKEFNNAGDRCITDASSAEKMINLQKYIPEDAVLLAVSPYSDKTAVSNDLHTSGWAGLLAIKNADLEMQRRLGVGSELAAYFAQLKEQPEHGLIRDTVNWTSRKMFLMYQQLTLWLTPLKEASSRGVWMTDPYGARVCVFPYLHSYVADLQEHYYVAFVRSGRCLQCLAAPSRLNALDVNFKARTEVFTRRVIEHFKSVELAGNRQEIARAKKLLEDAGVPIAMKVFVFAINGLFEEVNGSDPVTDVFVSFLDWYMLLTCRNRPQYHTEKSLEECRELGLRFGQSALDTFGEYQKSEWNFIKFHQIPHYPDNIWQNGLLKHLDTDSGESFHGQTSKKPYRMSNKRNAEGQIVRHNQRRENISDRISFYGGSFVRDPPKVRHQTVVSRQPGGVETATDLPRSTETRDIVAARVAAQPELRQLERRTRVFLAGGLHGVRGGGALLVNQPNCLNSEVHVANAAAIAPGIGARFQPTVMHARAAVSFSDERPYYNDVAIKAAEDDPEGPEYYGQLRLLFSLVDQHGKTRELAFVRYYKVQKRANGSDRLDARTCRQLKWEKYTSGGQQKDFYDVIELDSILRMVYIAPDFADDSGESFYLSRFKWYKVES